MIWLAVGLTNSPLLLGMLGLARAIPAMGVSPIAGVIADRVDERKLIFLSESLGVLISLGLAAGVSSGRIEFWHLLVAVALQATLVAFESAARLSLFPRLVPIDELPTAVALSTIAGRASQAIGPIVGGLAIAVFGSSAPFLAHAFLAPALIVASRRIAFHERQVRAAPASLRVALIAGIHHVRSVPIVRALFRLEVFLGLFQINPLLIALLSRELGAGPDDFGVLVGAMAAGSLCGMGWLLLRDPVRHQGRLLIGGVIAYAATVVVLAVSGSIAAALVVLAVAGAIDALVTVTRQSILQVSASDDFRGRIMANMGTVTRATGTLSETQTGILASLMGVQAGTAVAGLALLVVGSLAAKPPSLLWNTVRDRSLSPVPGVGRPESPHPR